MRRTTSEAPHDIRQDLRKEEHLAEESGAHVLGTGIGTALGGIGVGAIAGSVIGPVGTIVGTVLGGVSGGLLGKAIAENVDPTSDADFWRETYETRPYFDQSVPFQTIEPAYRLGTAAYSPGVSWEQIEPELATKWDQSPDDSSLPWELARPAAKDAFVRSLQLADTVDCYK